MNIYRIAHPLVMDPETGRTVGPYNASRIATTDSPLYPALRRVENIIHNVSDGRNCPTPFSEGHSLRQGRDQSAFASVEQADQWFTQGITELREAGFLWFTYEVAERHVRITPTQAIAHLRRARLLSIQPLPFADTEPVTYCDNCDSTYCYCWDTCDNCGEFEYECCCW